MSTTDPDPYAAATPYGDLSELPAEHPGRRAVRIAAAGGHHLALSGPGPGRTLLTHSLHALLPDLDPATAAQVADLYRCAGFDATGEHHRPPWQAPHHTMSTVTLIGSRRRPGAVSLAHAGVLFLDHAGDLPPTSVSALRQVLDDGRVLLGPGTPITYPARPQLVLASTGCPVGETTCTCPPAQRRRYHARLAVLLDRIDLRVTLTTIEHHNAGGEDTATTARRVHDARAVAAARWHRLGEPAATNATVTSHALKASLRRAPAHLLAPLRRALDLGTLSARAGVGVLRVTFTVADLAGHPTPTGEDLAEAITLRSQPF